MELFAKILEHLYKYLNINIFVVQYDNNLKILTK